MGVSRGQLGWYVFLLTAAEVVLVLIYQVGQQATWALLGFVGTYGSLRLVFRQSLPGRWRTWWPQVGLVVGPLFLAGYGVPHWGDRVALMGGLVVIGVHLLPYRVRLLPLAVVVNGVWGLFSPLYPLSIFLVANLILQVIGGLIYLRGNPSRQIFE
ncbi:MAG TPA: hypothetical protein H9875_00675 [Candidatus Levilactobacillus faecigallinarum]|uniref:Uncharacterized protein n=1 Tax=Candidatus Levilactobacillus faecigallinarum TaxID=2838638 RepID=A0A9D1U573_9LACO|nr:hypothetical protein [Candidatus Levilactobacillus faecigallinarum]